MDIHMHKAANGCLVPSDEDAQDNLKRLKLGQAVLVKVTRQRNYQFHKKWFALVKFAFDYWEPKNVPEDKTKPWLQAVLPQKSFDRFRKDLTILAGYYEASYRLDGSVRVEARSISFASMSEDEFEEMYSATIQVILNKVCTQFSEDELREAVDGVLSFA